MYFCYYNKGKKISIDGILEKYSKKGIHINPKQIVCNKSDLIIILFDEKKYFFENNDCLIIGRINIYNKENFEYSHLPDLELVAYLYKKNGVRLVELINGDFSFVIWDKNQKELHVIRDHIGNYAIYYFHNTEKIMISPFLPYLLYQIDKKSINQAFIKTALCATVSETNQTVYDEVFRFVPASIYTISRGKFSVKKYWHLRYLEKNPGKTNNYLEQFSEKFKNAVTKRMITGKNGFEVSGGIDSSSIVCTALKYSKQEIYSFSHIMPDEAIDRFKPFTDERKFVQKINEKYPRLSSTYISKASGSIIDNIRDCIKFSKDLPQQQLHIMADNLYRQVEQNNIELLFSGFGGDEVITSSGYYHFLDLGFNNRYGKILKSIYQRKHNRLSFTRLILKKLYDIYLYKLGFNHSVTGKYQKDLFIRKPYLDELLTDLNTRNQEPPRKNYYCAKLEEAITRQHITSRIENCNNTGFRYGFVFRHPMVDKELLELYFSLPYETHNTPNWPRNLIRQAMQDIVPDENILRRDKIGGTIPNVSYRIFCDQFQIREYINGYNKNSNIATIVDLNSFANYFERSLELSQIRNKPVNYRTLINYLTIFIFFEMYENNELF